MITNLINSLKKVTQNILFVFMCIYMPTQINGQNFSTDSFPDDVQANIKILLSTYKSKNYKALIELGEVYKKDNLEYKFVYDSFIIGASFELKDFDKVIELTEPYISKKESLLYEWEAETVLGQAYIMKERIEEGCSLLKKVKTDESQFTIAYISNCFAPQEYTFSISGKQANTPTNLNLTKGDVIDFKGSGKVSFGMFSGFAGPEGFTNGAFRNYNRTQELNHGELFFTISSDPYLFYTLNSLSLIKSSGHIIFHINDKDVRNNSGSFKGMVKVYKKSD